MSDTRGAMSLPPGLCASAVNARAWMTNFSSSNATNTRLDNARHASSSATVSGAVLKIGLSGGT